MYYTYMKHNCSTRVKHEASEFSSAVFSFGGLPEEVEKRRPSSADIVRARLVEEAIGF